MRIECKTAGCGFHVEYEPWEVQYLLLKAISTLREQKNTQEVSLPHFNEAVKKVVLNKTNHFNATKTAYLTCDNSSTPHVNAYQVPSK